MSAVMKEKTFRGLREISVLGVFAVALFFLIALVTFSNEDAGWTHSGSTQAITNACGVFGAWAADFTLSFFGLTGYLFPLIISGHVYMVYGETRASQLKITTAFQCLGSFAIIVAISGLLYLHALRVNIELPGSTGGILGQEIGDTVLILCGNSGGTLFLIVLLLSGLTLATELSWVTLIDFIGRVTVRVGHHVDRLWQRAWASFNQSYRGASARSSSVTPRGPAASHQQGKGGAPKKLFRRAINASSALPSLDLLDDRDTRVTGYSQTELEDMSRLVEKALADFSVSVSVAGFYPGPVITRFELQLAAGVKVSRISTLAKDLARALSVTSVRIVEVIPGKPYVGLEIPNREREMVSLRELLAAPSFGKAKSVLTLAMGKDVAGEPLVADLGKMPHALVAGTTGSGKSVAINTMILSLLYKATPDEVRLIMIDPKMLELSVYEDIPHLLTPVVTDMKEASNALRWAVVEMDRRYKLMAKMGVRNLAGFNQLIDAADARGERIRDPLYQAVNAEDSEEDAPTLDRLPSIVIVIDELADMMMVVGKKVEELIARLAQKARASGIHLILATQRPSVDVLTGLIKANVPTRISFQVSSRIDSRTILDQGGAEMLLGNGDMLFLPSGTSIPVRVHGAFVDDHEVHRVVEFLKQTAPPNYLTAITQEALEPTVGYSLNGAGEAERDELYDAVVAFVIESRKASISSVQRRFKVGYNRAASLIESLEAAGIVSAAENNGVRVVLAAAI